MTPSPPVSPPPSTSSLTASPPGPPAAPPSGPPAAPPSGPPAAAARRLYIGGVLLVGVVLAFGLLALQQRREALAAERAARAHQEQQGFPVLTARVVAAGGSRTVTLPGDVRAFRQVTLYAKVSGYLREIRVDKGDAVAQNALIGVLESPETDQQVLAVEADLAVKQQLEGRYRGLVGRGVVSQQEMERAHADVEAARAELARLQALKAYEMVRAPFAGTITARYVDPGALLPAATGATQSAQPIVDLADMTHLRIFVYVAQSEAPYVRDHDVVQIRGDDDAGLQLEASITRISRALDPRTRTMLAEIDLDNADGAIYPGLFVRVTLQVRSPAGLSIPADAVVMRQGKPQVAVIEQGVAHFRSVRLGDDDGHVVRVLGGLQAGEVVGLHVGDEISEGAAVRPLPPAAP